VQLCIGRETQSCYRLLQWARMRARGESIRTFCLEGGWRTGLRSFFLSIARHCIVTRNAGARITYLVQYLLNKSGEPCLQRIRTLTLPLGQDLPCEVVGVGYW